MKPLVSNIFHSRYLISTRLFISYQHLR